jgi:DMSO/TMAO reductase YedYZ molybdopterin-dependent catalytic subunit
MGTRRRVGLVAAVLALVITVGALIAPGVARVTAQQASPVAAPTAGEAVQLIGLVATPGALTVADLQTLPNQTADVTFQSGSGEQHHTYTGVLLCDVLSRATLQLDPDRKNDQLRKYAVLTAKDGYEVVISLGEIDPNFGNHPYLLAWEQDGQPLTGDDGPVRLVTPGDIKGGRYETGVVTIEVRDVDSPPRA